MADHPRQEVGRVLAEHSRTIEELHHKLLGVGGDFDKKKLEAAIENFKKAHQKLHDDCLECWKP
ncbi:MAG: hypothetical protein IAI49_02390 [Candidatus Eremiobacteraeota bacterium]|nr:hypothetical protein [Candidatus Eremiobacteraeota bacterium]